MARTLEHVKSAVAAALSRYLTEEEQDAQLARELSSAVAALMGVLLEGDERWSRHWWVDDVLPDAIQRGGRSARMSGLVITGDERQQWIEPFRAVVALSPSGTELVEYQFSVGDASVGLGTVSYGGRRPVAWPEVQAWLFTFGQGGS